MVHRPPVLTAGSLPAFRSEFRELIERVETAYRNSEEALERVKAWPRLLDSSSPFQALLEAYRELEEDEENAMRERDRARQAYISMGVLLARAR